MASQRLLHVLLGCENQFVCTMAVLSFQIDATNDSCVALMRNLAEAMLMVRSGGALLPHSDCQRLSARLKLACSLGSHVWSCGSIGTDGRAAASWACRLTVIHEMRPRGVSFDGHLSRRPRGTETRRPGECFLHTCAFFRTQYPRRLPVQTLFRSERRWLTDGARWARQPTWMALARPTDACNAEESSTLLAPVEILS